MLLTELKKLDADTLWSLYRRYEQGKRELSRLLCGGSYKGYTSDARSFASCACNLAVAKRCENDGKQLAAQVYELCAERCLDGLRKDVQCAMLQRVRLLAIMVLPLRGLTKGDDRG